MDHVEAADGDSVLDRAGRQPELEKLPPRDHPVLPCREHRDRSLANPADQRRQRRLRIRVLR